MEKFNWQYVIDGVVALFGLYVFLSAIKMKITGEISSIVASPEELYKCKNKKNFADAVAGRMLGFGLVTFLYGAVNIINEMLWKNKMFSIVTLVIFLLACGVFVVFLRKARAEYVGVS